MTASGFARSSSGAGILPSGSEIIRDLAWLVPINALIGFFLFAIDFGAGLAINAIVSQCIGLTSYFLVQSVSSLTKKWRLPVRLLALGAAIAGGAGGGFWLSTPFTGIALDTLFRDQPAFLLRIALFCSLFGTVLSYFFISRKEMILGKARVQEEKMRRLDEEKRAVEMHLKMLQAQIEPHFLFNTLANIQSLLDSDPQLGKKMLADLCRYLRTTLVRTRLANTTLGQELEIIRAYLEICRIRMGDRLRYTIELPSGMEDVACPPMLILPLVENAVQHGLEPAIKGGSITLTCSRHKDRVLVMVRDTGVGISAHGVPGTGTSNIRERLAVLYGDQGRLIMEENQPHGVIATLEYPHGSTQGDSC